MGSWTTYSFNEIIEDISDGGTPSRSKQSYFDGTIPWIVIDDIQDYIYDTKEKLTESGLKACSSKLWPKGTIILSTGATIGEVGIAQVETATKQGICGIRVNESLIDNVFFMYYLKYIKNQLLSYAQGSTIKEIRPNVIRGFSIYAPKSIDEQHVIGEVLSKVDVSIKQTQKLIEKYNRIKVGLMHELLTKGIDEQGNIRSEETHKFKVEEGLKIPNDWNAESLPFFCDIQNGKAFSSNDYNSEEGIRLVKPGNLAPTGFTDWNNKHVAFLPKHFWGKNKDYQVFENELLMNLTAQSLEDEFLGRVCITSPGTRCLLNQRIARIKPKNINLDYLFWAFKSKFFRNYVDTMPSGTKVQHLYNSDLENAVIAAPKSLEEQKKIAKTLFDLNKLINELHSKVHKLQRQKKGLMQDLLTGEKRVTNLVLEDVGVR
ncbi:restriction endonuclease subunit S [Bacillus mycoides]|uniref:restriction endonuclease subunit S n=1 Tax=Bacillus mycoides TaxID=1405 RepID=UPI002E244FAE|nr:restriction endonuclease subunit S [Bacillus mycoides]MED0887006.1 restriction endonuclease subunit S [Bacillus mycoides]MED0925809.1 restriction endonuclease subunit S [Bacillus mycoides]